MKYDVFISYSSHDQKIVEGLCAYLEQYKIRCFVAYRDIPKGKPWPPYIPKALNESRIMVVVFSHSFNHSEEVDRELTIAGNKKKPILTFRLSDEDFKDTKEYYLSNINWIDAFPNPEDAFGNITDSIAKLLDINIGPRKDSPRENIDQNKISDKLKNTIKLAELGIAQAQYELGLSYFSNTDFASGGNFIKNYSQAVKWYSKSAEQGHIEAQVQLGICYKNGLGVAKNEHKAYYWWQKAAEQGHEAAISFINSKERHKLPEPQKSKIIPINGIGFKMIKVDGGTFEMGSIDGCADEQPIHQVTLSDYYIAETLVTQEIWNSVMGSNPSNFKNAKSPVENVSWDDCQTFIEKLNSTTGNCFRLPTEAEWEYAARGGQFSNGYIYSGSNNIEEVAWWWKNSNKTTHPVKTKKPNELGIYDMSGNVWEWCEDDNSKYQPESVMDPLIQDNSSSKIERGGCWDDNWGDAAKSCRVSYRSSDWKTYSSKRIGFRLAMSTAARIKDQEQAAKELPQTIKIPFDDKSFNMLLSADKSYYIGCVTDTKNEYKWLKSNSSIKISHVAIAVSAVIFPIPTLIAFLSYSFFSNDEKEKDRTKFFVDENLCNKISKDIIFAVPQAHELNDVKDGEKKYCIVIRISDNPKLHDFLTATNAKN